MSAAKVKHAIGCPAYRTLDLTACTCGAPGSAKAQANVATAREAAAVHADVIDRREEQRLANVRSREQRARAAEQLARDEAAAQRITANRPRGIVSAIVAAADRNDADGLSNQLSSLLGRRVHVEIGGGVAVAYQCCAACRADIRVTVTQPTSDIEAFATVGGAARKAYLQHRCAPVEPALLGFTYAELEALHAELERDGSKMLERAAEIERMLTAQSRNAT